MNRCMIVGVTLSLLGLPTVPSPAQEVKPLKPFNVPFNTAADEDDPHVADGGLMVLYSSNAKGKIDIWFTKRPTLLRAWAKNGQIIDDYVSTRADDRSAFATQGKYPRYLYYATKKDKMAGNYDLYVAVQQNPGKAWSAVTPVMKVNTPADEIYPWLTADGKSLYFSRKTEKGWELYVTTRDGNTGPGGWEEPKAVGLPINFHHATLTPNGKTMYVQGPVGKDRLGLFRCQKTDSGWSEPEPLKALNSTEGKIGDCSPNLTRDGQFLYFASDRPGGKGGLDIYGIRIGTVK